MIDLTASAQPQDAARTGETSRKVLRMVRNNDRMAGSVPVWTSEKTAREDVAQRLAAAGSGPDGKVNDDFRTALAYHSGTGLAAGDSGRNADTEYGFFDLLDIVNPLQHIPIVGSLYREVTGDEIKPVSQIIGGGVFGGVAGIAGSAVNVIVEEETGRDIAGNVIALIAGDPDPASRPAGADDPETRLSEAMGYKDETLPGSAIAFADLTREPVTEIIFWNSERVPVDAAS